MRLYFKKLYHITKFAYTGGIWWALVDNTGWRHAMNYYIEAVVASFCAIVVTLFIPFVVVFKTIRMLIYVPIVRPFTISDEKWAAYLEGKRKVKK